MSVDVPVIPTSLWASLFRSDVAPQRRLRRRRPPGGRLLALGVLSACVVVACGDGQASEIAHLPESAKPVDPEGLFVVTYEPASPETAVDEQFLRDRSVLEDFADNMNDYVRIPREVKVMGLDCGESNAFYNEEAHSIELCYELVREERESFSTAGVTGDDLDISVYRSVVAVLYHELGHALIGELELPITGREEDVADQMAAYILTSDDDSKDFLLTAAESYALAGSRVAEYDDTDFSDTHSLDPQRSANFLCYVYGSDETTFRYLVDDGALNEDRAESCAEEYEKLSTAWDTLLEPHIR
ncbi:DUF4344 domain-containing metallopeptidase [Mycolicibacterium neoaurum]|uniref:DUF4344 domain-containing metallopeptidase n=1 Tax=Mycolicibacterium neoaurum TaxID=1795 RepID=UPI002671123E|nr:DUF4344 domain-containing metallopeptidase [Mycolicibacterium neoaurum]MDO3400488.1 DUF4344 domain-containing metallopeptidase [Mycolicibacterium neoaurum]